MLNLNFLVNASPNKNDEKPLFSFFAIKNRFFLLLYIPYTEFGAAANGPMELRVFKISKLVLKPHFY